MLQEELVSRSPFRILDKTIHGGLGTGNLGVIASRKGVGKTACLVHLATDRLLQKKHVVHVSYASRTDHIVSWYEDIFQEIARNRKLDNAMQVHDEIIRNRVLMNFNQEGTSVTAVLKSVGTLMSEGSFDAEVLVVDGFDFAMASAAELHPFREFAAEHGVTVWFSATVRREDPPADDRGVPQVLLPYIDDIEVLVTLAPAGQQVKLNLIKDHDRFVTEDLHLHLDPKTLLIAED